MNNSDLSANLLKAYDMLKAWHVEAVHTGMQTGVVLMQNDDGTWDCTVAGPRPDGMPEGVSASCRDPLAAAMECLEHLKVLSRTTVAPGAPGQSASA